MDVKVYETCPLLLPQDKDGLSYDGFITINVSETFAKRNHVV